ncbi:MAG: toprim domain-containing protein [Candidatus Thorarchaeota archaeon]
MSKQYTSKDVRVLKEIEHIQLNPGMYVGETNTPTHLIEEALDNALDEALAGYAKIIAVMINTKDHIYSVLDSGRGIPISGKTPITISSKLFSGAKFQDKKTAYEISSGLHGVGLVAVNALSSYYKIEVFRNKKRATYEFKDAKLKKSKVIKHNNQRPFSTKIEFTPNKKYFETLVPDLKRIRKRLTTASAEMPDDISFVLSVDGKQEVFKLDKLTHFAKNCLSSTNGILPVHLNSTKKPEKFNVIFSYENEGPVTPKIISSVNLLPVDLGGSHVIAFQDIIRDFFHSKGKKHGFEFHPNDSLYRLRAYLMLSLIEPKFSGQTKEKLTNPKPEFEKFLKEFRTQLESFFQSHEEKLIEYLKRFQEYRKRIMSRKIQSNGASSRRAFTKFTKLRDCTSKMGELYIVEGESAGGSIIQSRDPRKHAILPLKGKSIPNVTTKKNILANKEVEELMKAMGTGLGPEFDIENLRYDKIICATDADHDGSHIACLVTMVIGILTPEIIMEGRYFMAQTPLFAINEGKTFIPIWNEKELEKARKDNRKIQRYKGLGEMNPAQLKVCLLDEKTRNLMPVSYSDDIECLVKLFSSAEEKRKLIE